MTLSEIDNKLPINLIWQTFNGDQTNFEFEYTTEVLFKNFEQNRVFDDGKLSTVLDNSVIIYSFQENKKYLILVPRIILMDQLKKEIIKHFPKMKKNIQLIGDSNNTFDENNVIKIHPLLPYEGDIIYEGRFGNSIRFGSTVKAATHKNDWSSIGNDGDPITIFRNGQSYDQRGVDKISGSFWVPCLENINDDQSSIYLTSTQQVPLNPASDIPTSYAETNIKESPTTPSQYSGNQILLNSGRLVFNAKNDHIILSADKSIHLSTRSSINLDTGDQIVLNTDNAKGKITLLSDKIYLGLPDGSSEGEVGAELQSLVLGEDLILVLNTIYYMISKIQGALAASNIETEQGTVSDASLLTNAQPLQTLLDNFKQLIGEPNSSPILSKTTKTNR
jgi:hypothetical protein